MKSTAGRVLSLYSGAGGLDLGFISAGFDIVYAVDWDGDSCQTYRLNLGNDIEQADAAQLSGADLPECDVVIGGPPCQGFSVAGHMDPADPRSEHVWHFVRLVCEAAPAAFVMENVKALGVSNRWKLLRRELIDAMSSQGYRVRMHILDARDFGVPQSRERVFFIGTKAPHPAVERIVSKYNLTVTPRSVLSSLPLPGEHPNTGVCKAKVVPAKFPVLRRSPYAGMLFNGQGRPIRLDAASNTLPASMGGNRTPIVDEAELREGAEPWVVGYHAHLMAGGEPAVTAPSSLRRITVAEAALLQTFPLGFQLCGPISSQYRQIGNAVPPRLAEGVAVALRGALEGSSGTSRLSSPEPYPLFAVTARKD